MDSEEADDVLEIFRCWDADGSGTLEEAAEKMKELDGGLRYFLRNKQQNSKIKNLSWIWMRSGV